MSKYRIVPRIELFRWIFAFALIAATLPLLLACGPRDEPTRERETREPARESRQTGTSAPRVLWERTPTPGSGISLIQQFRESTPTSTARPRSAAPTRAAPAPTRRALVPTRDPTATPVPEGWVLTQSEAIHRATYSSYAADVEKLLDQGADTGAQASLRNGKLEVEAHRLTPLHLAAGFNPDLEVAALLLECGANIEAPDYNGRTSLHWAALNAGPASVELLLDQGANIEAQGYGQRTPLHQAARNLKSPKEAVAMLKLLERGASIEALDNSGLTPLLLVVSEYQKRREGAAAIVEALLDQGVDIEAHQNGWTALHFAAQFDLPEIAEVLLDQGADSKATNNNGQTPCQVARQLNSFTGTQLLGRLCRP